MKLISALAGFTLLFAATAIAGGAPKALVSANIVCAFHAVGCEDVDAIPGKPLFIQPKPIFTLADISNATLQDDTHSPGSKMLLLTFKDPKKLHDATVLQVGRTLAIFVKGELVMTPSIHTPFSGNAMAISGKNAETKITPELTAEINAAIAKRQ